MELQACRVAYDAQHDTERAISNYDPSERAYKRVVSRQQFPGCSGAKPRLPRDRQSSYMLALIERGADFQSGAGRPTQLPRSR